MVRKLRLQTQSVRCALTTLRRRRALKNTTAYRLTL